MGKYSIRRYNRNGKKSKQNISFKKYGKQIFGGADPNVEAMKNKFENPQQNPKKVLHLEGLEGDRGPVQNKMDDEFLTKLNARYGKRMINPTNLPVSRVTNTAPAPAPTSEPIPISTSAPIPEPEPIQSPSNKIQAPTASPSPSPSPPPSVSISTSAPAPISPEITESTVPESTSITDICSKTTVGNLDQSTQDRLINSTSQISKDTSVCKLDFAGDGPFVLGINGKIIVIKKKQLMPIVQDSVIQSSPEKVSVQTPEVAPVKTPEQTYSTNEKTLNTQGYNVNTFRAAKRPEPEPIQAPSTQTSTLTDSSPSFDSIYQNNGEGTVPAMDNNNIQGLQKINDQKQLNALNSSANNGFKLKALPTNVNTNINSLNENLETKLG